MALISRLAVALTVQTGDFANKLKSAGAKVQAFGAKVADMGKVLAKGLAVATVAVATAATAAAAAIAALTARQLTALDATGKLADRLGETTENLIGLQHAAELSGASAETLEKSLVFLQKTIGRNLTAEASEALTALGLSVDDLLGKRPAEQIKIIADAMGRLATQEQKAAVQMALFGRSGTELGSLFAAGSEGIAKMVKEAEELGATVSRFDIGRMEMFNDNVTRLRLAFTGLFRQIAAGVAGPLTALTNIFVASVKTGVSGAGSLGDSFSVVGEIIIGVADKISEAFDIGLRTTSVVLRSLAKVRGLALGAFSGEGEDTLIFNAERIDQLLGERQALRRGPTGFAQRFRTELAEVNRAAEAAAQKVMDDLAKQDRARQLADNITSALRMGFERAAPWLERVLTSGAVEMTQAMYDMGRFKAGEIGAKLDFAGAFAKTDFAAVAKKAGISLPSPIQVASAGVRGSFASETAGRSSPAFVIQQKQLAAMERIADAAEDTADFLKDGVPAG